MVFVLFCTDFCNWVIFPALVSLRGFLYVPLLGVSTYKNPLREGETRAGTGKEKSTKIPPRLKAGEKRFSLRELETQSQGGRGICGSQLTVVARDSGRPRENRKSQGSGMAREIWV